MKEVRRLDAAPMDHYINFLEKNGFEVNQRARMILPTDKKSANVAGDIEGIPSIHNNFISLFTKDSQAEER